MSTSFEHFGLQPALAQAVKQLGFENPTPIQSSAIPVLISGRDVVGQAHTGTGKTAAFILPMLQGIERSGRVQGLVLAPTRELAIQVAEAATRMAGDSRLRVLAVYGGQSYSIQARALQRGVDVVVGTPGRLLDLMRQELLDLSAVSFVVLDEADEMLEMGFIEDVEAILSQVNSEHQTALFSATLPEAVRKLAERYLRDPQEIRINPTRVTVAETEQRYCRVREENKLEALTRFLELEDVKSALIFARTKARVQDLADELARRGYPAASLHGDLNQARREYVLDRFRQGDVTLLVATDVAARGLDIEDVSHVFNYDVPGDPEDYVHRIGRTGRAGRKGVAITLIQPKERRRLAMIEAFTRQSMSESRIPGREELLARRDERFLERLTEQLGKGKIGRERALLAKLEETSFNMVEIAAAAIQLARAGEGELKLADLNEPAEKRAARQRGERSGKETPRERDDQRSGRRDFRRREPGMVRLWMNLGDVHGLRPSDVVGAIASEAGIPGKAIGEIDIRKTCTFVDVSEQHVRQVLQRSTGQYQLRGKPVMLKLAN